ncbi:MAG: NAD(P)-binding protein [Gemmatimonadetes bacterium]|nr:NAD(P)-binding protein [Gemmatimonadota bacterium]
MPDEHHTRSPEDRDLGLDRPIDRRDFLNGMAVGIGALGALSPAELLRSGGLDQRAAVATGDYPPAMTGLRGSHDGAFENAHRVRDGMAPREWSTPADLKESYDLIVVGAGISGLSAAWFYRQRFGASARILILDNHDDFGGHARRNEFTVDGKSLISYGGTQSIDTPSKYSPEAKRLLRELGIDTQPFYKAYDQEFFASRQMGDGVFFNREKFGRDALVLHDEEEPITAYLARTPLADSVKKEIARLYVTPTDYLPGRSIPEKKALLARTSYADYLSKYCHLSKGALTYFQSFTHDLFGVGIDAVPAGDCVPLELPGFAGLGLDDSPAPGMGRSAILHSNDEPYIFHFPDGNATIARLLVRGLVPGSIPGRTMYDVVGARVNYATLDRPTARVRVRLSSTVVHARNAATGVEVTYVRNGRAERVKAGRCVMACWNGIIPHILPEVETRQAAALKYGSKVPLLYTNVALRNWKAMEALQVHSIFAPGAYFFDTSMDFPVSIGGTQYPKSSGEPVVVTMHRTPCVPGLPVRDQQRAGRGELLATPYATYERNVRDQLARMLGKGGFDPARDIAAITVNRWSHGYAYEYNSLWDPTWPAGESPCEIGRQPVGNITIANSDAAAYAYTDAAIDMAWRAVRELR